MPEYLTDYSDLLNAVKARLHSAHSPLIVAIAGPPATGKSTLAESLVKDLRASGQIATFCPMDGFHKTNAQLDADLLRNVKGRIDTFDAAAFERAVTRLTKRDTFWWPLYSRQRHDPVPEGTRIEGIEDVYVVEGNYILTNADPWRSAAAHFDLSIFLDAPDHILMQRLKQRHKRGGKGDVETSDKIARVDMPNAELIRNGAVEADILFHETVNV